MNITHNELLIHIRNHNVPNMQGVNVRLIRCDEDVPMGNLYEDHIEDRSPESLFPFLFNEVDKCNVMLAYNFHRFNDCTSNNGPKRFFMVAFHDLKAGWLEAFYSIPILICVQNNALVSILYDEAPASGTVLAFAPPSPQLSDGMLDGSSYSAHDNSTIDNLGLLFAPTETATRHSNTGGVIMRESLDSERSELISALTSRSWENQKQEKTGTTETLTDYEDDDEEEEAEAPLVIVCVNNATKIHFDAAAAGR